MPLPFIAGIVVGTAVVFAVQNRKTLSSKIDEFKGKTLENLDSIKDKDIKGELKKVASKGLVSVSKTLENASQKLEEKAENLENSSEDESLKTLQNDASISKQDEKLAKKPRTRRKTTSEKKDDK
ncbi:MAG: hypothetical protein MR902_00310 [Campylobacter sp.]|nr:hypothetical protein [Campylobacter sp.]